jgi:hypothetical protein
MPSTSLIKQLANRAKSLHESTGIAQTAVAQAIGATDGNYSAFLAGKRGLGAEPTCLLLQLMSLSANQVVAKLSKKTKASKILRLQENGKGLKFDNIGWIAREGGTDDPVDTTSIDNTSSANTQSNTIAAIVAALLKLKPLDRQVAIDAIVKAFPNPSGVTPSNNQRLGRKY